MAFSTSHVCYVVECFKVVIFFINSTDDFAFVISLKVLQIRAQIIHSIFIKVFNSMIKVLTSRFVFKVFNSIFYDLETLRCVT